MSKTIGEMPAALSVICNMVTVVTDSNTVLEATDRWQFYPDADADSVIRYIERAIYKVRTHVLMDWQLSPRNELNMCALYAIKGCAEGKDCKEAVLGIIDRMRGIIESLLLDGRYEEALRLIIRMTTEYSDSAPFLEWYDNWVDGVIYGPDDYSQVRESILDNYGGNTFRLETLAVNMGQALGSVSEWKHPHKLIDLWFHDLTKFSQSDWKGYPEK